MGATSSATQNIKNKTVTRSTLEVFNSTVNSYVSNIVTKNAASCSASSSQYIENTVGKIQIVGKGNKGSLDIESAQDSEVNLQCIQQSLQQTNIGNEVATSIMQQLLQKVDSNTMSKLVTSSEAKNEQGFGANPFAAANSEVDVTSENDQYSETNRKLSNLVSNTVANNINSSNIADCFIKNTQAQINKMGNIKLLGEGNVVNIKISSKQLAKSFATCEQLNQQTSAITSQIAASLGLKIVDDKKLATTADSAASSTASVKTTGIEGIFDAIGGGLNNIGGMIASVSSVIFIMVIIFAIVMKKKGSVKKDPNTGKWTVGIDGVGEIGGLTKPKSLSTKGKTGSNLTSLFLPKNSSDTDSDSSDQNSDDSYQNSDDQNSDDSYQNSDDQNS